ncbi:hypothetical protein [Paraliobacillus ryukyuensis]|uniref:hypothetical protein n=1 Tax=Paraliobacillus ryukyuensis TaxID=200904 RepID=UPI0009A7B9B2|nr:hypothetical protein [Paraliobacillus ryukyuensis]
MIINRVRMESAAGWYLGSIEFVEDEAQPYDRHSLYYPSEEWLKREFPRSISLKDAFDRGMARYKLR